MDPDRYCLDEAAPPGSSLYYATLFAGARERAALVAIHALRHTLLGIVDTIADSNVRAHKLNWWSDEIMEARAGHARHPVSVAIVRHGGRRLWHHPEVLAVLSAVARASAANGLASETARDDFCEGVGGGTAQLCVAAVAFPAGEGEPDDIRVLGAALERAMLAAAPTVRSGLKRIPDSTPGPPERINCDDSSGGVRQNARQCADDDPSATARNANGSIDSDSGTAIWRSAETSVEGHPGTAARRRAEDKFDSDPGTVARRVTGECIGDDPDSVARRIAEERTRAHQALASAVSGAPRHAGPAALVYRTLAHIQLAALANALRKPARTAPRDASITPLRKLWIAWRITRRDR